MSPTTRPGYLPGGPVPRPRVMQLGADEVLVRTHEGVPVLDATDTARRLRLHSHDPLFRRYDQLRATGALRPVTIDPVPLYRVTDVDRLARPWEYTDGEPARGAWKPVVVAALVGAVAWAAFIVVCVEVAR